MKNKPCLLFLLLVLLLLCGCTSQNGTLPSDVHTGGGAQKDSGEIETPDTEGTPTGSPQEALGELETEETPDTEGTPTGSPQEALGEPETGTTPTSEPLPTEPPATEEFVKLYQRYYESCPQAAYPAEKWISEDGTLKLPADNRNVRLSAGMSVDEKYARFYVPEEAMCVATTANLLELSKDWLMAIYQLFNYPSHFLLHLTSRFNAADEMLKRPDLAEAVLAAYKDDVFSPKSSADIGTEYYVENG